MNFNDLIIIIIAIVYLACVNVVPEIDRGFSFFFCSAVSFNLNCNVLQKKGYTNALQIDDK